MPQTYFTFARTLPPSSKISKSVMALLEKFGWNKLIIIVGRRNEWIQIKDAIKVFSCRRDGTTLWLTIAFVNRSQDSARDKNIDVTDVIHLDDYIPAQVETINKIAEETYKRTRSKSSWIQKQLFMYVDSYRHFSSSLPVYRWTYRPGWLCQSSTWIESPGTRTLHGHLYRRFYLRSREQRPRIHQSQ